MTAMISNEQWNKYEAQYGGLIHTIAKKISGDLMTASYEDNVSDIQVAAIESIDAYERKTGQSFDQAFGTTLFDKYTKTVLWNRKAKKGIPLTKRMKFRQSCKTINNTEGKPFDMEDVSGTSAYSYAAIDVLFKESDSDVSTIVDSILSDPSVVTEGGRLKSYSLAKSTGISIWHVRRAVEKIRKTLEKEYGI